jgi:hypothetical protein
MENSVELSAVEGVGELLRDPLLEVRIRRRVLGYVGRNPVSGAYRYYRKVDGMLAREENDLDDLLGWVAHRSS